VSTLCINIERETSKKFSWIYSPRGTVVYGSFLLGAMLEKLGRMAGQHCELRVYIKPNK